MTGIIFERRYSWATTEARAHELMACPDRFRMCRNHRVHDSNGSAASLKTGPHFRELIGRNLVPGQRMHSARKPLDIRSQSSRPAKPTHSKSKLRSGDSRDADLHRIQSTQAGVDRRETALDHVARYVGIEHEEVAHRLSPNSTRSLNGAFRCVQWPVSHKFIGHAPTGIPEFQVFAPRTPAGLPG